MSIAAISSRLADHAAPAGQGPKSPGPSTPTAAADAPTPSAAEQSPVATAALKRKLELARLEKARLDSTNTPLAEGNVGRTINVGA